MDDCCVSDTDQALGRAKKLIRIIGAGGLQFWVSKAAKSRATEQLKILMLEIPSIVPSLVQIVFEHTGIFHPARVVVKDFVRDTNQFREEWIEAAFAKQFNLVLACLPFSVDGEVDYALFERGLACSDQVIRDTLVRRVGDYDPDPDGKILDQWEPRKLERLMESLDKALSLGSRQTVELLVKLFTLETPLNSHKDDPVWQTVIEVRKSGAKRDMQIAAGLAVTLHVKYEAKPSLFLGVLELMNNILHGKYGDKTLSDLESSFSTRASAQAITEEMIANAYQGLAKKHGF